MGITIVVGGQFGSEGKGKVSHYFSINHNVSSVIRVGGINSGHTVIGYDGKPKVFRVIPTAAIEQDINCVITAGSYFDPTILFEEIDASGVDKKRVKIHPNAGIITDFNRKHEEDVKLRKRIGSTNSGTGSAVSFRVMRDHRFVRACDLDILKPFVCDTTEFLRNELRSKRNVLIEGTQGFGLSNLHSSYYPKVTSRDTTAAGFLSESGLSPFDVTSIVMVLRTFPIRVAGDSGPLPNEISWDDVTRISKQGHQIKEYTSVTHTLRRVARFDSDVVRKAISANDPNCIVLNHLDYIPGNTDEMSYERKNFVNDVEKQISRKISYAGLNQRDVILL